MREGERERPLLGGGDRPLQTTQHTFSEIDQILGQRMFVLPE